MHNPHITTPTLVIVSGLPGSGKTTVSQRIADHFSLPVIQKDMIKETMCDILECTTLSQSQLYGKTSITLMYQFAAVILKSGQSCIIESVFHPKLSIKDLYSLQQQSPFLPLQIHCHAEVMLLTERIKQRWESGQRHPGHMEHMRVHDPDQPFPQEYLKPLPLDGHTIELDTTDFDAINYQLLFAHIHTILNTNRSTQADDTMQE